jgi:AraC family transcriptional regulator of adaptative response / DNA-3-methyladenine glycosylase II
MFDLSTDVSVVADHLGRDPLLAPLVRRYPAPRVPGAWDGFELAVGAILAREPAATGASLAGRIASEHGEPLSFADSGGLTALFPSARVLADARLAGIPPASAESIRALARAVNSGDVVLEPGESIGSLPDIPGIGEEIAEYVAMRALREPDAFPAGDLLLRRAAGRHEVLAAAALRERSERWRPWRAYAAVYLWRSTADATTDALPAGLTSARRAPDRDPRGESERKAHPRGGRHDRPRPVAGDYARA